MEFEWLIQKRRLGLTQQLQYSDNSCELEDDRQGGVMLWAPKVQQHLSRRSAVRVVLLGEEASKLTPARGLGGVPGMRPATGVYVRAVHTEGALGVIDGGS